MIRDKDTQQVILQRKKEDMQDMISLSNDEQVSVQSYVEKVRSNMRMMWQSHLSPTAKKIRDAMDSHEEVFGYIADNKLIEKSRLNG